MRFTIYDFFDAFHEEMSELSSAHEPSTERIKVLTMAKIDQKKQVHRPVRRITQMAAAIAAVLMLSGIVYAAYNWTGFTPTDSMSEKEIQKLMDQIEVSGCVESVDPDGTVHYFDSSGNEIMVLSPEEAICFEQARQEETEKRNKEAAQNLLDTKTLTVTPRSITAVSTGEDGTFGDFLLSNGSLAILHEEGRNGYELHAGDVVTITMDASDACIMEFGLVRDGTVLETDTIKTQEFEKSYTIPKDGLYCFTLMYFSSDSDNFTNCTIHIE